MLIELAIKNFAIIDDIKISFSKGLSILTGETGAGKSIIIEAVNLLLGGRASADLVRSGEKHAELEALFLIEPNSAPARIMKEYDFNPLEGLKIRRIISLNGRHKIFINSQKSTIQTLKLVTENLASISSQHAHQGLLNEENHLDIIDTFAGTWADRKEIQTIYNELVPLVKEISSLKSNIDKIKEENELLRFQIDEIEKADIKPQEDETLEMEKNRLKNGSQIYSIIQSGMNDIYSKDGSVLEKLGSIKADFEKYSQIDKGLGRSAQTLSRAMVELEDLTDELRKMSDNIDLDPDSLEHTQARLDLIQRLKRKYGGIGIGSTSVCSLDELFKRLKSMKETIAETDNIAERIEKMEKQASLLSAKIGEKAIMLSKKRSDAATKLAHLAENELRELEMVNTKFDVLVDQTIIAGKNANSYPQIELSSGSIYPPQLELCSDTTHIQIELSSDKTISNLLSVHGMKIYPTGIDRVSFLMAPNLGEPPKPLNRIASGGELSRVVLALKAVLSANESQGTLVFDEVDAGIGGRTSDKVGIKLKKLSEKYQVICITHLAQIAKHGTTHYKIEKKVVNNRTSTVITPLLGHEERIGELARMMGGSSISQATLDHAAEMLS
ncbi:MAG: DNA repair protein RecN [Desulfamplus sp.]|nr:DNA repair protein RecN [Desulfamplus sp.]